MNRKDVRDRLRDENPDLTTNVVSNTKLNSWCLVGDREVCTKTRLIKSDFSFNSTISEATYNLEQLEPSGKFYDIDDLPGSGIIYDNKQLDLVTPAILDMERSSWRTSTSGQPRKYFRRNEFFTLDRAPDAVKTIQVYTVLRSDDWDNDSKQPFNDRNYLEPFHYVMVLYLRMRALSGIKRRMEDAAIAKVEYDDYVEWMKKEVNRGTFYDMQLRASYSYRGSRVLRNRQSGRR